MDLLDLGGFVILMFWARDVVFGMVYIVLILVEFGFWDDVGSNFGVGLLGSLVWLGVILGFGAFWCLICYLLVRVLNLVVLNAMMLVTSSWFVVGLMFLVGFWGVWFDIEWVLDGFVSLDEFVDWLGLFGFLFGLIVFLVVCDLWFWGMLRNEWFVDCLGLLIVTLVLYFLLFDLVCWLAGSDFEFGFLGWWFDEFGVVFTCWFNVLDDLFPGVLCYGFTCRFWFACLGCVLIAGCCAVACGVSFTLNLYLLVIEWWVWLFDVLFVFCSGFA